MSFDIQNAAAFIPQRHPFVFVDELHFADETKSIARFKITPDNLFARRGYFSTPGMVESMAQTAAAGTGYLYSRMNRPVPVGYIGAVQKLEITGWPPVNAEINIEIKLITHILQVSLVTGVVSYEGKAIASCEMKIFIRKP